MMPTTKITPKTDLLELLYSKEIEMVNAFILEEKENLYMNGKIELSFEKVLCSDKKYTRDNLVQLADIFENYGWYVKIIESECMFDFS